MAVRAVPAADDVGDAPATFAAVYSARFLEMVRLAYLLTSSREAAHDIAQDSFLGLYRKWDRVRDPRAYLRRSVVNASHGYHRSQHRHREKTRSLRPETADLSANEMFDAIAALPYRQRTAIVLRYWHDADDRAIANALGCRVGTVGSLIHRAHAVLRKGLP
jgi:RNA polymerase sigma factor (sigma-70 family)